MNHSITRLVVGEPIQVRLGRRVTQTHAGLSAAGSLHWCKGSWVPSSGAPLSSAAPAAHVQRPRAGAGAPPEAASSASPVPLADADSPAQEPAARTVVSAARSRPAKSRPRRRIGWALAGVAAVMAGAGLAVVWTGGDLEVPWSVSATSAPLPAPVPKPLPIAPAPAPDDGGAVRVVSAPYTPDAEAPSPAASGTAPIPSPAPAAAEQAVVRQDPVAPVVAPAAPVASAASAPSARLPAPPPVSVHAHATPAKPKDALQAAQVRPAVILDEATPVVGPVARPASLVASSAKAAASSAKVEAPVATRPPVTRGSGLVAITPDGKSAVFTNPKTRLPVQYKVGEQLPGGDSIRAIDFKEGKVVTSTKEYSLD